jgi:uncharacterized protein
MATGYYELKKGGSGKFSFVLKAGNHEPILASQSYDTKSGAEGGMVSVQKNGPDANNYEKKTSSSSQPFFVLKASNGQIIGTSEMYSSESARDNGIASVQTNSPTTTIKDLT